MNASDNSYPVALVDDDGATIQFEAPATDHEDWQSLIGGNFKVVLEGDAAPGFESLGASAELAVTISFGAYE